MLRIGLSLGFLYAGNDSHRGGGDLSIFCFKEDLHRWSDCWQKWFGMINPSKDMCGFRSSYKLVLFRKRSKS